MLIRAVNAGDLDALLGLADSAGFGITTLPRDREQLRERIERATSSFAGRLARADQCFIFVLEDEDSGRVCGVSAIEAAVGLRSPWYNYRLGTIVHASAELDVYSRHETLFLSNDHTGSAELCTLYLLPEYRGRGNGALLSKSRLLFMAAHRELFGGQVVAEIRGVADAAGVAPFWEGLGRHFFTMEFAEADYLTGVGQKSFVAELMPKHPVYVDFLPATAREAIGVGHPDAQRAIGLLQEEGMRYAGYVDIFDAGPTLQAELASVRAVRESRLAPVKYAAAIAEGNAVSLVSNTECSDFRCIMTNGAEESAVFAVTENQARRLLVAEGVPVLHVPLSPLSGGVESAG
ncbi:arginine N-succinyltransferase [Paludibacterium yongneupense]|uniref:arginine N-succinyltransferase n=1 Tax=Paludibacterium yongneupense TaxID=400061 RepID=UPI0004206DA3|nr:arginine N-succinyltransferase [Paludibacterium yongneupense]